MIYSPFLRYTAGGYVLIEPGDTLPLVVDALLETDYGEEFCLALDFSPVFVADLMAAGFLVMSTEMETPPEDPDRFFILLPKLHLERSVLFFPEIHIKKSIRPLLSRYELRVDTDFDRIQRRCVELHGTGWLTGPLCRALRQIRRLKGAPVRPVSFGVYREGELRAGEFGVIAGRVYTSYSGYYDEADAGTVQMILMTRWLEEAGFSFLDLGMPLDYKDRLGARNISPEEFVFLFRNAAKGVQNGPCKPSSIKKTPSPPQGRDSPGAGADPVPGRSILCP